MTKYASVIGWFSILLTTVAYAELQDPTRPATYNAAPAGGANSSFELSAIKISADRKIAIIDDQIRTIGDQVGRGYFIVDIKPNTVTLTGPNGKMTLLLWGESVKRESVKDSH